MDWKTLLKEEIDGVYANTEHVMTLSEDLPLDWKPQHENNWMTTGQLLKHITNSCGQAIRGFVTGDWGLPEGIDIQDIPPDEMLPKAEKMPAVESVAEAKRLLAEDKLVGLDALESCTEEPLMEQRMTAPWGGEEMVLGRHILHMIQHLFAHKNQLFYYLKLYGKRVDTMDMWKN